MLGLAAARQLQSALAARGIDLVSDHDVLNDVWTERPPLPAAPVFEHVAPFAPTPRAAKLAMVRAEMKALGATHHFVSTVDDIAWLTNLRGADVQYNPVFLAHLLIDGERATLFIGEGKIAPALKARLEADGVVLAPYARAAAALAALPSGATLLIDPRRVTHGLRQSVARDVTVIESINPSTLAKSRKTDSEAHHIRAAMEQDGAALAEFFAWFEGALGHETITELTIDEHVTAARARRPGYVCPSFPTIAGFNANGALPHYRATEESHATICMRGTIGDGLLLIDSGGQYEYGTTDITRVVAVGHTTAEQRRDFTLVLKGMIALSRAKFPRGTRSPMLDSDRARADLGRVRGLRPRHRPRRGLLPQRARRSARHHAAPGARAADGNGARHGDVERAGPVPAGQMGRAHREPRAQRSRHDDGVRRVPAVRDADPVPDRHAPRRPVDDERRRTDVARQLPRRGAPAHRPARERARAGLAHRAHAAARVARLGL